MNPITSNTLLTYSLTTLPDPLQASPLQGNIAYGALSIVISNSGGTVVQLSQLQFTLPVGTLAQQLTSNPGAILYAASPTTLWNITMTSPGVFLALPQSGSPIPVSTDGMVFQFYNIPVNQQVGTVSITVNELATNTADPAQTRSAVFNVAKFPYGFYFGNFTAQVPLVQEGSTVTLLWQGSDNATYTMQWSAAPPVDVTEVRSWASPALISDTTFLLQAQVTSQGETVTRDLATTVIVANPELQASSLQVTGVSNLQGATTIGNGGSSQATVNGNLTVNGATLLSGTTTLSGNVTAANVAVNGTLTSGSTATFNNLVLNGTLAAIKGAQVVGQGTYTAQTDGFLIASINSKGISPGSICWGWIFVNMPWYQYVLSSGNYALGGTWVGNGGSVMSIPVQQSQSCSITIITGSGTQVAPNYNLVFVPLGNIPQSQEAFVKTSDEVPAVELPLMEQIEPEDSIRPARKPKPKKS
jgi:hypothetical protein